MEGKRKQKKGREGRKGGTGRQGKVYMYITGGAKIMERSNKGTWQEGRN
jgi:hypothetical protein